MLTYPDVGATRDPHARPAGYHHTRRHLVMGSGQATFTAAVAALRDLRMFRAAGLAVRASAPEVAVGVDVTLGLGAGPVRLWAPCRVVWMAVEPGRFGYALGTLAGHPESGEEAFEVWLDAQETVWAQVRAFSRPALWYARAGGPVTRLVQHRVTGRYLRALRRLAMP